jgi:hypothetical protein
LPIQSTTGGPTILTTLVPSVTALVPPITICSGKYKPKGVEIIGVLYAVLAINFTASFLSLAFSASICK